MNPDLPLYEPDADATYQLDIAAKLTGISSETILHYQEFGLIHFSGNGHEFDDETLHTIGRIEHLRSSCEANLSGVKRILELMNQVEQLQRELRTLR